MQSSVCGIDLGTTYSCLAYIDETGNPVVAKNNEGSNTTPSVVSFQDNGDVLVGQNAKDDLIFTPDRAIAFVKRLMGETDFAINVDGADKTPEEVSSYILRKVASDAARNAGLEVNDVVITVPAYFGDLPRTATQNAGQIAGLNVLRIIQEPVAAAVYYGCMKSDGDTSALVYDLGGGTFDVSVIDVKKQGDSNAVEVVWSDGDKTLGGKDWDAAIIDYLKAQFVEETGADDDFDLEAEEQFQQKAEDVKMRLSGKTEETVRLNIDGTPAKIPVTRETFEALTLPLLQRTIDLTKECAEKAKTEKGVEVDRILLVGGSTRMPQVEEALKAAFPDIPIEINDPDEAVAKGAALCALDEALTLVSEEAADPAAAAEADQQIGEDNIVRKLNLPGARNMIRYATSKSYGTGVIDSSTGETMIANIIKKNMPIDPETHEASFTVGFGTASDNQREVMVEIFENDNTDESFPRGDAEPIREQTFELNNKNAPSGYPIDVTFTLNEQGLLSVTATEVETGNKCDFEVQTSSGMSADEVDELKATALKVRVE